MTKHTPPSQRDLELLAGQLTDWANEAISRGAHENTRPARRRRARAQRALMIPSVPTDKRSEGVDALTILAAKINAEHAAAYSAIKTGIDHAMRCGALRIEAKAAVPHGDFAAWITTNTALSERSAQRYMQLSRERPALEAKAPALADLTIERACNLVARTAPAVKHRAPAPRIEHVAEQDETEIDDDPPSDTKEVIWRRGLLYRAEEAANHATFEPEWADFEIDAEIVDAAKRAFRAWEELADFLISAAAEKSGTRTTARSIDDDGNPTMLHVAEGLRRRFTIKELQELIEHLRHIVRTRKGNR